MTDQTPEERIAELEAQLAAARKPVAPQYGEWLGGTIDPETGQADGGYRGPLHPDVQPQYMNGSVVLYDGVPHRVVARTIAADGTTTYDLHPVSGRVVHVDPNNTVHTYGFEHELARNAAHAGLVTYDLQFADDAERVYEVAEADLEPFRPEDVSLGAKVPTRGPGGRGETAQASESGTIIRE